MVKKALYALVVVTFATATLSCKENSIKEDLKHVFNEKSGRYAVFVDKKEFTLKVYNRDGEIMDNFKIGYGLNPDRKPKLHAGDERTPEGVYYVTEILSMDATKNTPSYQRLKAMNSVFFRAKDGHYRYGNPEADLGDNAYGPRFFRISYPSKKDIIRYNEAKKSNQLPVVNGKVPSIGSGIAIHGNCDPKSIGHLSSSGCIRMYNRDIVELEKYIQVGTPVVIVP